MFKKQDQTNLAEVYLQINEMNLGPAAMGVQPVGKPVIVTMDMPGATMEMEDDCEDNAHEHDPSEIQMAAAELHKLSEYAPKLKQIVQQLPSMEGWVAAKITKASDYISSVYHYLEFEQSEHGCNGNNMYTSLGVENHCEYAAQGCTCGGCSECH
jgi:hypothetical protein